VALAKTDIKKEPQSLENLLWQDQLRPVRHVDTEPNFKGNTVFGGSFLQLDILFEVHGEITRGFSAR